MRAKLTLAGLGAEALLAVGVLATAGMEARVLKHGTPAAEVWPEFTGIVKTRTQSASS